MRPLIKPKDKERKGKHKKQGDVTPQAIKKQEKMAEDDIEQFKKKNKR